VQRSQISQLVQMGSIGISDTTPVDSPGHLEEMAHCWPSFARPRLNDLQAARRRELCRDWHLADIANLPNVRFAPRSSHSQKVSF
jgi:hypothetical protein